MSEVMLEVRNLTRRFDIRKGLLRRVAHRVTAVENVSFTVRRGEALGVVGESGCGKSTLAKMLVTAMPPTSGSVRLGGQSGAMDLGTLDRAGLRAARRRIQMVFQDPFSSLNPRMTVAQIVGDPLIVNRGLSGKALRRRVAETLELVGLNPRLMDRYPHAFSGGQRQRIGLARALVLDPEIIVADEPVSALDVSVQAQILNLLDRLRAELGLTFVFISHDLGVVQHLCDRLMVMYSGRVAELGATDRIFAAPAHPYVETLIDAAPTLVPQARGGGALAPSEIADPAHRPTGCAFHPRCSHAEPRCRTDVPDLRVLGPETRPHRVACHRAGALRLRGVPDRASDPV